MKNKLLVQQFIEQHPNDWEKHLQEKPYCLLISYDNMHGKNLVMFKYNMVESSFAEPLVCECRGLVLDADTKEIVSFPFTKFFNAGEFYAANLDWKTAKVATKIDGSLVKIVNVGDNKLVISTNGTIDAFKAPVAEQVGCPYKSFGDIVLDVLSNKNISPSQFEVGYTYMFELVSPYTKIVIPYKETDMYYLGRRNNATFQEEHFSADPFNGAFKTPEIYPLQTLDQCISATAAMPWDEEGYVACDASFNRVKIKSPAYLAVHHIKGNGVMSYSRAIELVRLNEVDEVLAYFPEFKDALLEVKSRYRKLIDEANAAEAGLSNWTTSNGYDTQHWLIESGGQKRKDLACWVMSNYKKFSGMLFGIVDKKIASASDFFMAIPADKLVKQLGYKE